MQVLVICGGAQEAEFAQRPEGITFASEISTAKLASYNAVIDLLFEEDPATHTEVLQQLQHTTIIVSAPACTCGQLPAHYIRVNGWPGFMAAGLVEACSGNRTSKEAAEAVFGFLDERGEWVPDVPGMISARVIAAIINEAYFTLSEGIATREDIDTAMKLGTAYPYGPFEWAQKIGLHRVAGLLRTLAATESHYHPCALLEKEAAQ